MKQSRLKSFGSPAETNPVPIHQNPSTATRRRLVVGGLCLLSLLAGLQTARSQTIYATRFESTAVAANAPLVGQDGWIGVPPLSPNAAVVVDDKPRQGKQTVRVLGADLVHQDFINELTGGYYDAIGSYRHPVNYDTGGAQAVRVSAHVRVDGPGTASGNNFFSAGISTRAATADSTAGVGEIVISSDGHVYAYTGNEDVPTFLTSAPVELGQWHELAVVADFSTHTTSFFVDGQWLGTFPFDPAENYTNLFLRGTLVTYAAPDTATLHKADYSAHFDKFVIQAQRRK